MERKKRYAKCIKEYKTVFEEGSVYRFSFVDELVNIFYDNGLRGFYDYEFFFSHFEIIN